MAEQTLNGLWRRYASCRDSESRARLMLAYWPLVKDIAARVGQSMPGHVDEGDLVSAGLFGLLSAIERYEPRDDASFEAFARMRIRGAIYDEMRALDWAPRHVRERAREVSDVGSRLEQRLRRTATYAEVAQALGLSEHQVHERLARNLIASVGALDAEILLPPGSVGDAVHLIETVEDSDAADPEASVTDAELRQGVLAAIMALAPREQSILVLHYLHGLTFREVGERLGLTESRISQIHRQVTRRLRGEIHAIAQDGFPFLVVVDAAAEALRQLDVPAPAMTG